MAERSPVADTPRKLLIAASGTGGHLFPAIATAEHLTDYTLEWLGVPDRLETELVPQHYPLHTVRLSGFQGRPSLTTLKQLGQFFRATLRVRKLLRQGNFQGVFTTGGYISAPAILAARSLGLPALLHESNALPGKVTRWLSPWCSVVALGFAAAQAYLPRARCVVVGTPVRSQFLTDTSLPSGIELPPEDPVILVVGGSQGAVAINELVRAAVPAWLEAGAWVVHQTGSNDPNVDAVSHPRYLHRPFLDPMAGLFRRASLVISRAGAGTLTELAFTHTPAILIPYPFAAEDHQTYNAAVFAEANAAYVCPQSTLTPEHLQELVLKLMRNPEQRHQMAIAAATLATPDSAEQLAALVRHWLDSPRDRAS